MIATVPTCNMRAMHRRAAPSPPSPSPHDKRGGREESPPSIHRYQSMQVCPSPSVALSRENERETERELERGSTPLLLPWPCRTATPAEGVARELRRGPPVGPSLHESQTGSRLLVRARRHARRFTKPEPRAVAPTDAGKASGGVWPASLAGCAAATVAVAGEEKERKNEEKEENRREEGRKGRRRRPALGRSSTAGLQRGGAAATIRGNREREREREERVAGPGFGPT